MDFINKQHIVAFEIGQNRRQVAGFGNHRRRSGVKTDTEFFGYDGRQGGFAQSRRAEQQHVVQSLAALTSCGYKHFEIVANFALSDKIIKRGRTQTNRIVTDLGVFRLFFGTYYTSIIGHTSNSLLANSLRAKRISVATLASGLAATTLEAA